MKRHEAMINVLEAAFLVVLTAGLYAPCLVAAEPESPQPAPADEKALRAKIYKLAAQLRGQDIPAIKTAIEALAETKSPLAAPHLGALYGRSIADVRVEVLRAFGKMGLVEQAEPLYLASVSEDFLGLRRVAAEGLVALIGREAAGARYLKALDGDAELSVIGKMRALQNLAHIGGTQAGPTLVSFLKNEQSELAITAADGLATLGDLKFAKNLIARLKLKDPEVQPAVVEALAWLTGEKHGGDLVAWEGWQEELDGGQLEIRAAPEPKSGSGEEDAYKPTYRDAHKLKVTEAPLDVVIVFDTTGSMTHIWPQASAAIDNVLNEMAKKTPSLRLGSVRYRADDQRRTLTYQIMPKPLTRDLVTARDDILDATFGGGSGGLHLGIKHAIAGMTWRAHSRKMVLIVGDTTPLDAGLERCVRMVHEGWAFDHIQFNSLYIRSIHGSQHKSTYDMLARYGAGRFYEYNKAWSHLADLSAEKVDVKTPEQPMATLEKWMTPLPRPAEQLPIKVPK